MELRENLESIILSPKLKTMSASGKSSGVSGKQVTSDGRKRASFLATKEALKVDRIRRIEEGHRVVTDPVKEPSNQVRMDCQEIKNDFLASIREIVKSGVPKEKGPLNSRSTVRNKMLLGNH